MTDPEVYRSRDFYVLSRKAPWANATIVLADDPDTLLRQLGADYLEAARGRALGTLEDLGVSFERLEWGSADTKFGSAVPPLTHSRLMEPFGTLGWVIKSASDEWFAAASARLWDGSPRLGVVQNYGSREGEFIRYAEDGNTLVPLEPDDFHGALRAFCADVLDDFIDFNSDYFARQEIAAPAVTEFWTSMTASDDGGRRFAEMVQDLSKFPRFHEDISEETIGSPPAWGAPWRAIEHGDRAAFDAAMREAQEVYTPIAYDVLSIGYHRRVVSVGLY